MGEYNTVVSTKISEEDLELLRQAAKERYEDGQLDDPSVSNLLRLFVKTYIRLWQEDKQSFNTQSVYPTQAES